MRQYIRFAIMSFEVKLDARLTQYLEVARGYRQTPEVCRKVLKVYIRFLLFILPPSF